MRPPQGTGPQPEGDRPDEPPPGFAQNQPPTPPAPTTTPNTAKTASKTPNPAQNPYHTPLTRELNTPQHAKTPVVNRPGFAGECFT